MNACYTMKVVTDFAAAHSLRGYPGDCSRVHGHNWKVEIVVKANALDEIGMGMDFKEIKSETNKILKELDHYNLNDIPPFDKINPTAENIAAYLYQRLAQAINDDRVQMSALTIWETERACVTYTED